MVQQALQAGIRDSVRQGFCLCNKFCGDWQAAKKFSLLKIRTLDIQMGVSENYGYPQIIYFNRDFHYKPSILG